MHGYRGTCQVHQRERAEADAKRITGHRVDLCRRANTLFEQPAGLVQPRYEESVDHEAGPVLAYDDDLAHGLAVLLDGGKGLGRGSIGWDNLDQSVLGRMVEEVQSDEAVRPADGLGEVVNG